MTRSQLDRLWRKVHFAREHHRCLLRWAKTDWERDARAEEVRALTWRLVSLSEERNRLWWEELGDVHP